MNPIFVKWRASALTMSLVLSAFLTACGGGGGSAASVPLSPTGITTTGKAPGVTYSALGEGWTATLSFPFDIDGGIKVNGVVYTLQYSPASNTCSFGTGSDVSVCSPLASGKVFLLCDTATGTGFQIALLTSDMTAAALSELAGTTMTGISCGVQGADRVTGSTLSFNADASVAVQVNGNITSSYGAGFPALLASPAGGPDTGPSSLHRWAIYKLADATGTTYLLFDLHQVLDSRDPDRPAYVYKLRKAA